MFGFLLKHSSSCLIYYVSHLCAKHIFVGFLCCYSCDLPSSPHFLFVASFLDLCMNPQSLKGALKHINANTCKAAGGKWTRFITNYIEKSEGVLDSCIDKSVHLVRGLPYESHLKSQGADRKRQYVVVQEPPEVIYAPSTVVNHNGVNMEGKFSSYKWKVPCFPTNTTQRCVLRIRCVNY